jgi:predicted dehydrogenase
LSADALRIGIVGAGYIAGVHSAAYRCVSGTFPESPQRLELVAVADADLQRGSALHQRWGWRRLEREWSTITRAEDVDVVDVCVPNFLHSEIAIDALAHGKHVICEKPLAHDLGSAREMCAAALHSPQLAQVCFYYRLWPAIAWVRELVASGQLGKIQHFRGWMLQDYGADPTQAMGWRTARSTAGAGALGDLGSHIIDIAISLCGEIESVNAVTRQLVDRKVEISELDDAAMMLVEFSNGASGVIEASWAMRGHKCDLGFDIVGERGAARFCWERCNEVEVLLGDVDDPASGFRRVLVGGGQPNAGRFIAVSGQGIGYRDAFTIGLGQALAAVGSKAATVDPTFEDGLRVAEVAAAALTSAESREWTAVERSHL